MLQKSFENSHHTMILETANDGAVLPLKQNFILIEILPKKKCGKLRAKNEVLNETMKF